MKSLEELKAIRERMQGKVGMRSEDASQIKIVVGMATCGIASGARPVLNVLADEVQKRGMSNVVVTQTGCLGLCQYEPVIEVYVPGQDKVTYTKMNVDKAIEMLEQHIVRGNVLGKYTLNETKL